MTVRAAINIRTLVVEMYYQNITTTYVLLFQEERVSGCYRTSSWGRNIRAELGTLKENGPPDLKGESKATPTQKECSQ